MLSTPFIAAFMPEVPHASSGRRGVFIQMSQPRVSGAVGNPNAPLAALTSSAGPERLGLASPTNAASLGQITLDFSDLDIRDATTQILGDILHVNYTVDPAVRGTATLHTAASMSRQPSG